MLQNTYTICISDTEFISNQALMVNSCSRIYLVNLWCLNLCFVNENALDRAIAIISFFVITKLVP